MALRRSQKSSDTSISAVPNLRSHTKRAVDGGSNTSSKKRVTVSESSEVVSSRNNSKTSTQSSISSPAVTASPSPIEEKEHGSSNQSNNSSGKMKKKKKNRRRHFRGATYSLFLSKKKKKNSLVKKSQDESKDDECSLAGTENSSFLDSEDGNSLMSEDLYTPSEMSLADEEANPDSRNSPLLATETKTEVTESNSSVTNNQQQNVEVLQQTEVSEPSEVQESIETIKDEVESEIITQPVCIASDEVSQNATDMIQQVEDMQWVSDTKFDATSTNLFPSEVLKVPQYDDISNESLPNSTSFPFKTSSENIDDKTMLTNESVIEKIDEETDDGKNVTEEVKNIVETTVSDSENKDFSNIFKVEENSNQTEISHEKASSVFESNDQDNVSIAASAPTSGDEHDPENQTLPVSDVEFKDKENLSCDAPSTIATCVKSRQRIKRRFTDDIVDTDVGLLSLNSSMAPPRKVPPKPDPPKDVIQTFVSVTHSEAKKGPITKIECIYNSHQDPVKTCACDGETYEANLGEEDEGVFCQAVDSIDDKLVGCTNPVVTPKLVRSSVKIPFTIMCEMHLWRLKHHHSCPYCGLFCSQGSFMQCSGAKSKQKRYIYIMSSVSQRKKMVFHFVYTVEQLLE
ncbi:uncharacterized protein CEXT_518661 [Caerostris extrusa]|uniref:EHMT1/2 cysteine-rich region domain-containing protein n=1 Tax=Caerostris extrusa TaxID=172846 RepID=A0AAV4TW90_CAEEX|nr:uncharacterized protein CEXT_518661 [Caerostris extrusa]